MDRSIRLRLLFSFIVFSLFILIISVLFNSWYYREREVINTTIAKIDSIYISYLNDVNRLNDFFAHETTNPEFFITGRSEFLNQHEKTITNLSGCISNLKLNHGFGDEIIPDLLDKINRNLYKYDDKLKELVANILKRGFKDFGIVGEMRKNIHALEAIPGLDKTTILMLRRHEKDYIIRNQKIYIEKLNLLGENFKKDIQNSYYATNKDIVLKHLNQYIILFNEMVAIDRINGLRDNAGLSREMNLIEMETANLFLDMLKTAETEKYSLFNLLELYYIAFSIFIITLSIGLSMFLSNKISAPLVYLSGYISKFVDSYFTYKTTLKSSGRRDEIGKLTNNFIILRDEIMDHINFFKKKVEERTRELQQQNHKILQQKEEIEAQRDDLNRKNKMIEFQKSTVEKQNKDIIDSIRYAKNIQDAILPSDGFLSDYFPESFVFYKPRDIISGDFYWVNAGKNAGSKVLIGVADCTGHGVPGALMSLLGYSALNKAMGIKGKKEPGRILELVNNFVYANLHNKRNIAFARDGMDIALIRIHKNERLLVFSGAMRPIIIVRDGEVIQVNGTKAPVGVTIGQKFMEETIELKKNDLIYLFTDGYTDQFGGNENKKFKAHRFRSLLADIASLTIIEQKLIIEKTLKDWQQDKPQLDDILIMGIRID